jgi:acetyl-CoA C-acetyltransferase
LANTKELLLDPEKVDVNGEAVSLGHPLGMFWSSNHRNLDQFVEANYAKRRCAGICNGGGGASAMAIELV